MALSFDIFIEAFLDKVTSYDFVNIDEEDFLQQVDRYLFAACADFENVFRRRTGLSFSNRDPEMRCFNWDLPDYIDKYNHQRLEDAIIKDEVVEIISEGMLLKWFKSFVFASNTFDLSNFIKTKDFSPHSPSNFISTMGDLYNNTKANYKNLINEFSYQHGELHKLHM